MSREIRRVPANWQHPKRIIERRGEILEEYRPMSQYSYEQAVKDFHERVEEWMEGYRLWQEGKFKHYKGKTVTKEEAMQEWKQYNADERKKYKFSSDYRATDDRKYDTGLCCWEDVKGETPQYPNPDDYMPRGEWFQVFEEVSEGTPITPPFATTKELIDWMATNKDFWGTQWSREGAENLVKTGGCLSMIAQNEGGKVKIYQPHEMHLAQAA